MKYQEFLELFKGDTPAENIKNSRRGDPYYLVKYYGPIFECIGVTQNEFHGLNETVYDHLLYSLEASTQWTNNPLLRLAILFHDVGKPSTKTIEPNGDIHFYLHEIVGATITYKW